MPLLGVVAVLALVVLNVVVFGKLIHVALAGGAPAARDHPRKTVVTGSGHHGAVHARARHARRAGVRAMPVPAPKPVRLRLTAARNDSWVEIRASGATGRVLFDGVVAEGQSVDVSGRRLWARFGAIGNFDLSVDGRAIRPALNGTLDTVITASGIRAALNQTASG